MEKRIPHTPLNKIKKLIEANKINFTRSAIKSAANLGMKESNIVDVVLSLTAQDFYKSMTSNADHKIWQEVYRPKTHFGQLYCKLTVIDHVLIVSCKEL